MSIVASTKKDGSFRNSLPNERAFWPAGGFQSFLTPSPIGLETISQKISIVLRAVSLKEIPTHPNNSVANLNMEIPIHHNVIWDNRICHLLNY